MATGSCLCGKLKYEFSGAPVMKAICHCLTCRKIAGSTYTTNLLLPSTAFKFTTGTPKTYRTVQDSGMLLDISFCGDCGVSICKVGHAPMFDGHVLVLAGTLDSKDGLEEAKPDAELYVKERVGWQAGMEGVGQMTEFS